jgi:hypothetical protein
MISVSFIDKIELFLNDFSGHGPYSHMFEEVIAELRPELNWKVGTFLYSLIRID